MWGGPISRIYLKVGEFVGEVDEHEKHGKRIGYKAHTQFQLFSLSETLTR
jgi:hypothetical protein